MTRSFTPCGELDIHLTAARDDGFLNSKGGSVRVGLLTQKGVAAWLEFSLAAVVGERGPEDEEFMPQVLHSAPPLWPALRNFRGRDD